MSSVYPVSEGIERLLCKGAPEVVLQRCDYIINEHGNVQIYILFLSIKVCASMVTGSTFDR